MKKLLPLLMAVMLIMAITIPANAAWYTVEGTWRFNEQISRLSTEAPWPYEFVCDGVTYAGFQYLIEDEYNKNLAYYTGEDASGYHVNAYLYDNVFLDWNDWVSDKYRTITFTYPQEMSSGLYNWFTQNAVQVCDGSTCPATDVNMDNVCDDCGMTFAVRRSYAPDGWPSSLPDPPSMDYLVYTVVKVGDDTWLYMVNDEVTATFNFQTKTLKYTLPANSTKTVQRYVMRSGDDSWVYSSLGTLTADTFDDTFQFIFTTEDIYDVSTGEVFFPEPLWLQVQGATQGGMTELTQKTVGTMKLLVLCGVGLLASLVVLRLFGKRSLIYRN